MAPEQWDLREKDKHGFRAGENDRMLTRLSSPGSSGGSKRGRRAVRPVISAAVYLIAVPHRMRDYICFGSLSQRRRMSASSPRLNGPRGSLILFLRALT